MRRQTGEIRAWPGFAALLALVAAWPAAADTDAPSIDALRSMSLEELSEVSITLVARRSQAISEAAGAVFLITQEDIRRAGVVRLPEALRLAPNLDVAREGGDTYAVTARGFNSTDTANKLLVMVDGRSVYSSLLNGVLWAEEHLPLEDVERIEVVSGPGGALWGANAVNGVVNVVTKSAADTQGPAARATLGDRESALWMRYGGRLDGETAYRVYARGFSLGENELAGGGDAGDDFTSAQTGARLDAERGRNTFMVDAQGYDNDAGADGGLWGGHLLGRWRRDFDNGAIFNLRAYYDHSDIQLTAIDQHSEVSDVAFRHALPETDRHIFIWGGGYRSSVEGYLSDAVFYVDPPEDTIELVNVFAQDTVALTEDLDLTVGLKLEHSSYSGAEQLPSVRLAWSPNDRMLWWAAVSRAVRTPSRLDRDLAADPILIGGPNFDSEELVAYEAGYRGRPSASTSLSVSVFYNDYDKLRAASLQPGGAPPVEFVNGYEGSTYGVEAWGDYQALDWWRLSAGVALLHKDLTLKPGYTDLADPPSTGADPEARAYLRSRMDLGERTSFDAWLRWADEVSETSIPAYTELNAQLSWRVSEDWELAVAGFDLLDESHPETTASDTALSIRRRVQVEARWRY